ncbi:MULTISPECIES: SDR family oxidoreductase [unclassified Bosea (in: a-proteobacteria)]|uniref:SDR family oxidoreductase n=1 Tax=unclassified Bosea (in: a-proteobacteria) TaxID=2653178 RepID=UPI000F75FCC2|nr:MULTISPECIES: SDR family oxidoreductase [unclassified Bosea (in: a-proteobacteria)]AZO82045.1 nucleoside-diphosphate sugar epimerase [Bosea sp. Tri-49]RXT24618.1 nucleoside-diphosphate sugar epimerase [Bosea sp. Tri-39]RXT42453.1 nucleoside-diphosphate sugar epimerase [Bosea sp. Tri-54]
MSRILIIGATGLIGTRIAAELAVLGHQVVGAARDVGASARRLPGLEWIRLDLASSRAEDWSRHLAGVDAVVNCAGGLQSGPTDRLADTHSQGPQALFAACHASGVRRIVHFSAIGVDRATPTEFSRTKLAGDTALMASNLDWVILRPSVVLGAPAYGASALIRGLAALPVLPVMPDTAPIQPVTLDDVAATAIFFIDPASPSRLVLELVGPEAMSFPDVIRQYRRWLGFRPAFEFRLPAWLAAGLYRLGDFTARLGWRPAVRSTARSEIARGAVGDPSDWQRLTGIAPKSLSAALMARPASVQEGWFARLYLLKPVVLGSLVLFWMGSSLASLGPGYGAGLGLLADRLSSSTAALVVIGGGIADLLIGVGIAIRRTTRAALIAGIVVSALYALAGTIVTPWLWLDPLAPLLKIGPVIALLLVGLATLKDR